MIIRKKGQTVIEYTVLIVIVIGAFIGASNYFKRGVQGRWKSAIDDMGDQYDPRFSNGTINHILLQNTETAITAFNSTNGIWTLREDRTNSIELKQGTITVFSY